MANDVQLVVQGVISGADSSSSNPPRPAHFLLPRAERAHLPAPPSPPCDVSPIRPGELQVEFKGWPVAPERWNVWVEKLRPRHERLWRELGILHAILATACWVEQDDGALLQLAAFWCGDTNTFVFPWGEATVTLEDVAVLGVLPLLGDPVFKPPRGGDARGDVGALEAVRASLCQSTWNSRPSHAAWAKHFSELPPTEDGVLEHAGFLAMWLSLFALPAPPFDAVREEVLPVAARLARGGSVALAPAALASIYGDLSALKRHITSGGERSRPFMAWAPLHILQLWVWERFPELRPETAPATASTLDRDVPRAVRRWHGVRKVFDPRYVHAVLMSPAEFEWAPYGSSGLAPPPGSYGRQVIARRTELLSFAHCLRARELVGMGCTIEQYLPHRVARQLGFDQDVPGAVARANSNKFVAWAKYKIGPLNPKVSFIVPRSEPTVTAEYEQWWEPCSRACAIAVEEATRMKVAALLRLFSAGTSVELLPGDHSGKKQHAKRGAGSEAPQDETPQVQRINANSDDQITIEHFAHRAGPMQIAENVNDMLPGWVRNGAKRTTLRKKLPQGSSGAEVVSKSLQPQPVTMPDEQNSISEQAEGLPSFGATATLLSKPSEKRQPVSTANNEQGNPVLKIDRVQKYCVSELAASLKNITLQQEPADGVAAVIRDASLLQRPTEETRNCAVIGEKGKRVPKGKFASLAGNSEGSSNYISSLKCASELAASLKNLTLQQEPADDVAAVRRDASFLQQPTKETRNPAVTGERDKRVLKGKLASSGGNSEQINNYISSIKQQMESLMKYCSEPIAKSPGNGGTSSSRLVGENTPLESTEVCTKTLYYLSRSDRNEDDWAKDANRDGDFFQPSRAVGTMEMIEKASAIRQAQIAELRETFMKKIEEIQKLEAAEEQERLNRQNNLR